MHSSQTAPFVLNTLGSEWSKTQPNQSQLSQLQQLTHDVLIILPYTQASLAQQCLGILQERAGMAADYILIEDDLQAGPIHWFNQMSRLCSHTWVTYTAQDTFPSRNWLSHSHQFLQQHNQSLLAYNDGKWQGQLASFGMVRRTWFEQLYEGDLFFSGYRHHYADVELTLIAQEQNQYAYHPEIMMLEVDYQKDRRPVNQNDRDLFKARQALGFQGLVKNRLLLQKFL